MSQGDDENNDDDCEEEQGDSASKPLYSYAALIGLALEAMPEGRATFHGVCQQISSDFPYYQR